MGSFGGGGGGADRGEREGKVPSGAVSVVEEEVTEGAASEEVEEVDVTDVAGEESGTEVAVTEEVAVVVSIACAIVGGGGGAAVTMTVAVVVVEVAVVASITGAIVVLVVESVAVGVSVVVVVAGARVSSDPTRCAEFEASEWDKEEELGEVEKKTVPAVAAGGEDGEGGKKEGVEDAEGDGGTDDTRFTESRCAGWK